MDKASVKKWFHENVAGDERTKARLWSENLLGAFRFANQHGQPRKVVKLPLLPSGEVEKVRFSLKVRHRTNGHAKHNSYGVEILPRDLD